MTTPALTTLFVLMAVAGCVTHYGSSLPSPSTRAIGELRDEACPLIAPEDPSRAAFRIDTSIRPAAQEQAKFMQPYDQGFTRVKWDNEWRLNQTLTQAGCVVLLVPRGLENVTAYTHVSHQDPTCGWGAMTIGLSFKEATLRIDQELSLGCQ